MQELLRKTDLANLSCNLQKEKERDSLIRMIPIRKSRTKVCFGYLHRACLLYTSQQILIDDAAVLIDGYYNSSMIYSKNVGYAKIHTADYYWLSTEIVPAE